MIADFLESAARRECRFAVVDPAVLEFVPKEYIAERLVPKLFTRSAHLLPALVDLQSLTNDQTMDLFDCLQNLYVEMQPLSVAIFITSRSCARKFASHWNTIQSGPLRNKQRSWFRIHDPRVLHQLLRILNPAQRRGLFGDAYAFHYWIGGKWITVIRDAENKTAGHVPAIGPVGWNWPRIERIGIVNRALHSAGIHTPLELTIQGAMAEHLIEHAVTTHSLQNTADLTEFTARGLKHGASFDTHSKVAAAIKEAIDPANSASLSDRFAILDDLVWNSFSNKLISTEYAKNELN